MLWTTILALFLMASEYKMRLPSCPLFFGYGWNCSILAPQQLPYGTPTLLSLSLAFWTALVDRGDPLLESVSSPLIVPEVVLSGFFDEFVVSEAVVFVLDA